MTIVEKVKLMQPEEHYGAVYGRNQAHANRRYVIYGILALIWVASVILAIKVNIEDWVFLKDTNVPEGLHYHIASFSIFYAWAFPIVSLFGGFAAAFGYNADVFSQDVYNNRAEYARTIFKDWFEATYNVRISESGAENLMDGGCALVWRKNDAGERERVKIRFEYNSSFKKFSSVGSRPSEGWTLDDWGKFPDVDEVDFNLMVVQEPANYREFAW